MGEKKGSRSHWEFPYLQKILAKEGWTIIKNKKQKIQIIKTKNKERKLIKEKHKNEELNEQL